MDLRNDTAEGDNALETATVTDHSARDVDPRVRHIVVTLRDAVDFTSTPSVEPNRSCRPLVLDNAVGTSGLAVLAGALDRAYRHLLVICSDANQAETCADDLALFSPIEPRFFPLLLDESVRDESLGQRLQVVKWLMGRPTRGMTITHAAALMQTVPGEGQLRQTSRTLEVGQSLDRDELVEWLVAAGYQPTAGVEFPGEFAQRGGLLDVFSVDAIDPVRIELFGDEIESLRTFHVESQRSLQQCEVVELMSMTESRDITDASLLDYLPDDTLVAIVEPDKTEGEAAAYEMRHPQAEHLIGWRTLCTQFEPFGLCLLYQLAPHADGAMVRLPVGGVERFSGDWAHVKSELQRAVTDLDRITVVCQTQGERKRLEHLFRESVSEQASRFEVVTGRLSAGFQLAEQREVILSSSQMFRRSETSRRRVKRHRGKAIQSFLDLREGDLVVHLAHGIGRYLGLKEIEKQGQQEEHLEVEFHGGTRVYVPATRIDLVQKYVGGRKARPKLARIGGRVWQQQKKAAERAVENLAHDLLELQAERASQPGIGFGEDTEWQHEFDAAFPYQETPDQLAAADDIKGDLASGRPMDRLLCGDVGFGKTELAMRAAFKAVDSGYQVAILAPTTILVEQHFHTFTERMAEYPFRIAKLSRFCSAAETRNVIAQVKDGGIDIVIGTHRLASKDVGFRNLGLLVIDEEQRFGVSVKERLKQLRASVNVLTLSATPIPRTLHMSLTGMRDISNLETAPEERVPVETRVTRWSDTLIRDAVQRELDRGGQIFFVHNRVQDIQSVAAKIQRIVPEAKIGIGHGQMPEHDLEEIMTDFIEHRFDLLLSTTIVESGLDIPNANTMFIDEAHRYGLAELHQLRGRVGRYKHHAYCYLLLDPRGSVTPASARRLQAIQEFSAMGAGFAIAMRDLEIRGAGNILGTQQSGHIATVGYELYCQLLEAAVRRLRKLPPKARPEVIVDLPGVTLIPRDYVPDLRAKIDLYRRINQIDSDDAIRLLVDELVDRFGPVPRALTRLLDHARLKLDAALWSIDTVRWEAPFLLFAFRDPQRIDQLVRAHRGQLRRVGGRELCWQLPPDATVDTIGQAAKSVLQPA